MLDIISNTDFWTYALIGFAAQMIDGALGMAYGTLCTSVLISSGVAPLIVSASVHSAQFFTTGLSALSHSWFKNVNKKLFLTLAVAGAMGGMLGAILLTKIDGGFIKPWIAVYLACLGVLILWKRWRKQAIKDVAERNETGFRAGLGFIGGFLDALGGGWGPMVTSNLIVRDEDPRRVIGSVNTAEFFVKTIIAVTLSIVAAEAIFDEFQTVVLGLLIGGIVAAPFGAYILKFIKPELLMTLVGILIIVLSGYTLYNVFF
jgi:uncharacterized membrane protein YfcA